MSIQTVSEQGLYAKGETIRRQLVGDERFAHSAKSSYADPMMKAFLDVATTSLFGAIWSRPGLDLKTRTLIVCVSDIATGQFEELRIHLQMALRQGWTREQMTEAILQLVGYAGAPAAREAMKVASEVYRRHDEGNPNLA